jgi:hypothetical protein
MYICESEPASVTYTAGRGAKGESLGGMGPILTSGTFAAPGAGNAIHRTYQGPTIGTDQQFSGAVNGSSSFFWVDNGPTFGKMLSAT